MKKQSTPKILAFIHGPMHIVSTFSVLKQLNREKQSIVFELFYKDNIELKIFLSKLLNFRTVSFNMAAPFIDLSVRFPYLISYFKMTKNLLNKLSIYKNIEVLIFPDRAHPMYRFLSILSYFILNKRTQILFVEEGLSHYYKDFHNVYTGRFNLIGRLMDRCFNRCYELGSIKHYSIRLFDVFKHDIKHSFTLIEYPFIQKEVDEYFASINNFDRFILLLPSSLEVVQELRVRDLVKDYWNKFLLEYSINDRRFKIIIKPHPVMSDAFVAELFNFFSDNFAVEIVPKHLKYCPAEYFLRYNNQIEAVIGYDSSTIVSFGPALFGETLNYDIIVKKIYLDYANKKDMTKYMNWNKADMELLELFGY